MSNETKVRSVEVGTEGALHNSWDTHHMKYKVTVRAGVASTSTHASLPCQLFHVVDPHVVSDFLIGTRKSCDIRNPFSHVSIHMQAGICKPFILYMSQPPRPCNSYLSVFFIVIDFASCLLPRSLPPTVNPSNSCIYNRLQYRTINTLPAMSSI